MQVAEVMTTDFLTARPEEAVEEAARRMVERWVGSAIVEPDGSGPGIVTERHMVETVAAGIDAGRARVAERFTRDPTAGPPDWSLERAAAAMSDGDFRHLVVAEDDAAVGVISMRDVVRCWISQGWQHRVIPIREAMSRDFLVLGRSDSLQEAARRMVEHDRGSALVEPPKPKAPPGIVTDREFLEAVAAGLDPASEQVSDHLSRAMTFSAPDWSLRQAAEAMTKGGFQHIVVVDGSGTVGIISMHGMVRHLLD